jgi:hypothetical protein
VLLFASFCFVPALLDSHGKLPLAAHAQLELSLDPRSLALEI